MGADLVPVAERVTPVRWLRAAMAALLVTGAATGATPLTVPAAVLVAVTLLFVVGLAGIEELGRRTARSGPRALALTLVVDGAYLAWASAATGGAAGIGAFLVLLHVVGVTLLVSYRTGVKIALWHSLLLYGAHELHGLGLVASAGLGAEPYRWVLAYMAVLGLVAGATACLSAVNERELRRRRADFEALAAFAAELDQAEGPGSVAGVLAERLQAAFGFPRVAVLGDEDASAVLATAGAGPSPATVAAAGKGSLARRACTERRTQLAGGLGGHDAGLAALLPGATNVLVVPLLGDGGVIGVVAAEHGAGRGPRIERRVVTAVERFADHGALALRAARLLEALHRLATVDGLTGAANRRAFDEALSAEISRAGRAAGASPPGGPPADQLALLLLDIDHFKAVNDTHGHLVGDDVLRSVAATLMAAGREFDTVARYGGEEFAVIVPGCDVPSALAAAERLRAEVERADTPVPVTVSVGVSLTSGQGPPAELIKAADDALLAAKAAGRNRVVLAPPRVRPALPGTRSREALDGAARPAYAAS